jgi:hypothetical protein
MASLAKAAVESAKSERKILWVPKKANEAPVDGSAISSKSENESVGGRDLWPRQVMSRYVGRPSRRMVITR